MSKKMSKSLVLTTKLIDDINKRVQRVEKLKNHEKIWFSNMKGVRKPNITFGMTNNEINEYMKCKLSVQYFAQEYSQIKREDGTVGKMTLRDYQKDIIDLYTNNRFSILMASRQTGKCNSFNTKVLVMDEETKELYELPFYELYYDVVRQERPLIFLEKCKIFLYRLYMKLS